MPPIKHAIIAAAGLGSRLALGKPKCLLEIEGKTLLARQLCLLSDVEDVRIITGYNETAVMEAALKIRNDITFVRNPEYRATTTLHSYALGSKYIKEPCVFMDADILFEPASFFKFVEACAFHAPLVGITAAKTQDAVYVQLDSDNRIVSFSRSDIAVNEWANLIYAPASFFVEENMAVYEWLSPLLPLKAYKIVSYEIDTHQDLDSVRRACESGAFSVKLESELEPAFH